MQTAITILIQLSHKEDYEMLAKRRPVQVGCSLANIHPEHPEEYMKCKLVSRITTFRTN